MVRSDAESARTRRFGKFYRIVQTIVIATAMGPLIGGAAVFLLSATHDMSQRGFDADGLGRLFFVFMYGAYLVGGVIAFVAGTLVAVAALWRRPTFVIVVAASVVSSIVCTVAISHWLLYDVPDGLLFITLPASAFAATICWLLFRRLLSNQTEPSP